LTAAWSSVAYRSSRINERFFIAVH
jgi:hypothetical protein